MITGIKITEVSARRDKDTEMTGLNVNIGVDSVTVKGNEAEIAFNYTVSYAEGVGELKMKGSIISREDEKLLKEIKEKWGRDKKLPDAFAEIILNAINYACGTNGVFVVRPVNLSPPIIPPRIQLGNEVGMGTGARK